MAKRSILTGILLVAGLLCLSAHAGESGIYCPQKAGFIKTGMTPDQVIAACGMPISKQESNAPVMQKIPVQQLFFNNQSGSTAFYGVWAIPGGSGNYGAFQPFNSNNGGTGVQLQVDIANNKVRAIKVNNSDSNAFSICQQTSIQVGDPASKVYNACGSPSIVNTTYVNVPIQTAQKPIVWIYQFNQYESPVTLTFVNGALFSIQ